MINYLKITLGILLALGASRFIPHPPNFTALGAIALFGGAFLKDKKLAFSIPIIIMILSDLRMLKMFYEILGLLRVFGFLFV